MAIKIITDSACDLPIEYIKDNNIELVPIIVNIKGEFLKDDLGQTLKHDEFYKLVRAGEMPSTSQVNISTFEEVFKTFVKKGDEIIYIGVASTLGGTVNSAKIARENILEKYTNADITIIDSLSVSLGEGAIVYYICEMLKKGCSKDEAIKWAEENKLKIIHTIVLDDLNHLKRGGRISGSTAIVGGILGIKPALKLDNEGKLISVGKIKGRKKVLKYIVNEIKSKAVNIEDQTLFICHADCLEEAEELRRLILEEVNVKNIMLSSIGAVVGSHGGPGTLATVFLGNNRD